MGSQRRPFDHQRRLTIAATATAVEATAEPTAVKATAEPSAMEAGMSKSASEAPAEPAVPTSSTAPPAAPAPADRDPGPTPAPAPRITPTSPTPVGVWIIGVGSRITIAGIALRRGSGRLIRISRIALRWRRGVAGIDLGRRRLRNRTDAQGDRTKSGRSNG